LVRELLVYVVLLGVDDAQTDIVYDLELGISSHDALGMAGRPPVAQLKSNRSL
jgi:hypothetical protein